ncbi:hypothetical protein B0H67DRAFT_586888 [Lasiosphaeris hirsuta]|uniref:Uncharacterized protein n=1 Tax=Lasiosphaeris hirsuta TaxID=260670 RepID=A0AA40DQR9_9PEZI|nr:hypothetical protein B0H67DRAFT_586888 [Lasiosphaeris hirsuta]
MTPYFGFPFSARGYPMISNPTNFLASYASQITPSSCSPSISAKPTRVPDASPWYEAGNNAFNIPTLFQKKCTALAPSLHCESMQQKNFSISSSIVML